MYSSKHIFQEMNYKINHFPKVTTISKIYIFPKFKDNHWLYDQKNDDKKGNYRLHCKWLNFCRGR